MYRLRNYISSTTQRIMISMKLFHVFHGLQRARSLLEIFAVFLKTLKYICCCWAVN